MEQLDLREPQGESGAGNSHRLTRRTPSAKNEAMRYIFPIPIDRANDSVDPYLRPSQAT